MINKKIWKTLLVIITALVCLMLAACAGGGIGDTDKDGADKDIDSGVDDGDDEDDGDDDEKPLYEPIIETPPVVNINTVNGYGIWGDRLNQEYVDCTVSVSGDEYGLSGVPADVKVRGNYTADYEKKPYRIKFGEKQAMLGLNGGQKFKNWVLLADYKDSSMLRNSTAFYLGKNILGEDGYYSADYRYVEVYVDSDYKGLYLLTEQQQVNQGRVDIAEPASDYTGTDIGYFFEYDGYYTEEDADVTFTMSYNNVRLTKKDGSTTGSFGNYGYTIKNDIYSEDQRSFISEYTSKVFKIAYKAAYENQMYAFDRNYNLEAREGASVQETVEAVIDVRSLVDMYILQEICCDYDIGWSSFFLSADMSGSGNKKLTFLAPWDFDSALGLSQTNNEVLYAANSNNPWLILLVAQDWFWSMVEERWQEISERGVFEKAIENIGVYAEMFAGDYLKNFNRWPNSMGVRHEDRMTELVTTFKKQADAAKYLGDWLRVRIDYLDSVLQID